MIKDCTWDGVLDRKYSNQDLRRAKDELPTDQAEYSDCQEIIAAAITSGSDKGGGRNSPGRAVDGTSAGASSETGARAQDANDLSAIAGTGGAENGAPPKVSVGEEEIEPGTNGLLDLAASSNELPTPLAVALIAIGLLSLAAGFAALRWRSLARPNST